MNFTSDQLKVVEHEDGHALINACPGSGKTTVIAALIHRLVDKGFAGNEMLVLMFGKDAQVHFTKKLASAASGSSFSSMPEVLTFHALCYRLCGYFAKKGFLPDFALETNDFKLKMMASTSLKRFYDFEKWKELQTKGDKIVDLFVSFIDFIKSGFLHPRDVCDSLGIGKEHREAFLAGYDEFEHRRTSAKVRFFADMIYDVVSLLNNNEAARSMIANRKKYVFVDEFQDINSIQYVLLNHLAGETANVIVIGDVDQSIYGWRGSDPEFMNSYFLRDYPTAKKYELTKTFRYGHELTIASNYLIDNNYSLTEPRSICVANKDAHETTFNVVKTESRGISALDIIQSAVKNGYRYDEIAILCRLYSDNSPIELELTKAGIPCDTGKMSVFESSEFAGVMSILKMGSGDFKGFDDGEKVSIIEALMSFPYVGMTSQQNTIVAKKVVQKGFPLSKSVSEKDFLFLKPYQSKKLIERLADFDFVISNGKKVSAIDLIHAYIGKSGLKKSIKSMALTELDGTEACEKIDGICEFVEGIGGRPKNALDQILEFASKRKVLKDKYGEVIFSSIHKAKGLEWPVVIIANAEENQFPYVAKGDNKVPSSIKEERRLFFVAMTRAINECHVLTPCTGNSKAKSSGEKTSASIFVSESRESSSKESAKTLSVGDRGIKMLISQGGIMKDYAKKLG